MAQTIDALDRGIRVLEILAERGTVKLAELPPLLGVSRATAFRLLTTLHERGYVERVEGHRGYQLGAGAAILASATRASALLRNAGPAMADLRDRTGETVNLALLRGTSLVYADMLDGVFALRMSGTIGEVVPLHSTALGKATLSRLPAKERRALLGSPPFQAYTPHTLTTWKALDADLALAAERGYAIEAEEMDVGAACVGAAIVNSRGLPVAAMSISGFVARVSAEQRATYGLALAEWCARISRDLGHGELAADGARPESVVAD